MRTRLATLLRWAVEWLQKGPRVASGPALSREELRDIVLEILSEQATRREQAAQSARAFGVEGAVSSGTPGQIAKFQINGTDVENSIAKEVDGKIGIGVGMQTPGARLESFVTSAPDIPLRLNTNFAGGNAVDFYPFIPGVSNDGFQLSVAGTGRLWIKSNGNVGIGTTAPGAKLESLVTTGGDIPLRLNTSFGGGNAVDFYPYIPGVSNAGFQLSVGGTARLAITPAGNVGIGTTTPQQSLTLGASRAFAIEMAAPGTPTLTAFTTGGSLATGTYFYKITALDELGETVGSAEASVSVTGPNGKVTVSWNDVPGASSYRIYRGTTAGGENIYYTDDASPFDDTGAAGTSGSPPAVTTAYVVKTDSSGNVQIGNPSRKASWQTLLLGKKGFKQVNVFGPEMITAAAKNPADPGGKDQRVVIWAGREGDVEAMFLLNSNGVLEWGAGGNNDQDIFLSRTAANQLTLTDTFAVAQTGDAQPRIALKHDADMPVGGQIHLGDGTAIPDVILYRSAADTLRTPDKLIVDDKLGIGTTTVDHILTVAQNSASDPIADAWTTYSSRRWKTNIRPLQGALEKVLCLRGVSFDWKSDGRSDIGLVGEEVGEVVPEVVVYEENGTDAESVDYARLTALLIEAIKEQHGEIEQLRHSLETLARA